MNEEQLEQIYEEQGFNEDVSFDDFKELMRDPTYRKGIYDTSFKDSGQSFREFSMTTMGNSIPVVPTLVRDDRGNVVEHLGQSYPIDEFYKAGSKTQDWYNLYRSRGYNEIDGMYFQKFLNITGLDKASREASKTTKPYITGEVGAVQGEEVEEEDDSSWWSNFLNWWPEFGSYLSQSFQSGLNEGYSTAVTDTWTGTGEYMANRSDEEYATEAKLLSDMQGFQERLSQTLQGGSIFSKGGRFAGMILQSLASQATTIWYNPGKALSSAGSGAAAGAAATSVTGPGVAAGASLGAVSAVFAYSVGDVSATIDYANKIMIEAGEQGYDITDPLQLKEFYQKNPDTVDSFLTGARRYGMTIGGATGVLTAVAPGAAGSAVSRAGTSATGRSVVGAMGSRTATILTEAAIQGTGFASAEGIGMALDTQEHSGEEYLERMWTQASVEGILGLGRGAIAHSGMRMSQAKLNNAKRSIIQSAREGTQKDFDAGIDYMVEKKVISENEGKVFKTKFKEAKQAFDKVPSDVLKNKRASERLATDILELEGLKSVLEAYDTKIDNASTETLKDNYTRERTSVQKRMDKISKRVDGITRGELKVGRDGLVSDKSGQLRTDLNDALETPGPLPFSKKSLKDEQTSLGNILAEIAEDTNTPKPRPARGASETTPTPERTSSILERQNDTNRADLDGKNVLYQGRRGKFNWNDGAPEIQYLDGKTESVIDGGNSGKTNSEIGLEYSSRLNRNTGKNLLDHRTTLKPGEDVSMYGDTYAIEKVIHDADGNVVGAEVRNGEGQLYETQAREVLNKLKNSVEEGDPAYKVRGEGETAISLEQHLTDSPGDLGSPVRELASRRQANAEIETQNFGLSSSDPTIADSPRVARFKRAIDNLPENPSLEDYRNVMKTVTKTVRDLANSEEHKGNNIKKFIDSMDEVIENDNRIRELSKEVRDLAEAKEMTDFRNEYLQEKHQQVDVEARINELEGVAERANKALKNLKNGAKVLIEQSPEDFAATLREAGRGSNLDNVPTQELMLVRGFFDPETGNIHLNPLTADISTVAHEAFHAVIHDRYNGGNVQFNSKVPERILKELKKGDATDKLIAKELESFVAQYEQGARPEEFFAELTGLLAKYERTIQLNGQSFVDRIKDSLNRLVEPIVGLKPFEASADITDVVSFVNTLSENIREGYSIDNHLSLAPNSPVLRVGETNSGRVLLNPVSTPVDIVVSSFNDVGVNTHYDHTSGNYVAKYASGDLVFTSYRDVNGKITDRIYLKYADGNTASIRKKNRRGLLRLADREGREVYTIADPRDGNGNLARAIENLKKEGFEQVSGVYEATMIRRPKGADTSTPIKLQKGPSNSKAISILEGIRNRRDEILSQHRGNAGRVFNLGREFFIENGIEPHHVARALLGDENPFVDVTQHYAEGMHKRVQLEESLTSKGMNLKLPEVEATLELYDSAMKRFADEKGITVEQAWNENFLGFEAAAEATGIPLTGNLVLDAGNIRKNIWQRAKEVFTGLKGDDAPTFFHAELELSRSLEGLQFLADNRRLIRSASRIENGKTIMYFTSNADAITPVRGLAHSFYNMMTPEDQLIVKEWMNGKDWDVTHSEAFTDGFIKHITGSAEVANSIPVVFDKFKNYLLDIYNDYQFSEVELNKPMRDLYSRILDKEHGLEIKIAEGQEATTYSQIMNEALTAYRAGMEERGVKMDGHSMNEVYAYTRELFGNPEVMFESMSDNMAVQRSMNKGYHTDTGALSTIQRGMERARTDQESGGSGRPQLSQEEVIGIAYWMRDVEKNKLPFLRSNLEAAKQGSNPEAIQNYQLEIGRLERGLHDGAQVVSLSLSEAGQLLGRASRFLSHRLYSLEAANEKIQYIDNLNKKNGRPALTDHQKNRLRELYKIARESHERARDLIIPGPEQRAAIAGPLVENAFRTPVIRDMFAKFKEMNPSERQNARAEILEGLRSEDPATINNMILRAIALESLEHGSFADVNAMLTHLKNIYSEGITQEHVLNAVESTQVDTNLTIAHMERSGERIINEAKSIQRLQRLAQGLIDNQRAMSPGEFKSSAQSIITELHRILGEDGVNISDQNLSMLMDMIGTMDMNIQGMKINDPAVIRTMLETLDRLSVTRFLDRQGVPYDKAMETALLREFANIQRDGTTMNSRLDVLRRRQGVEPEMIQRFERRIAEVEGMPARTKAEIDAKAEATSNLKRDIFRTDLSFRRYNDLLNDMQRVQRMYGEEGGGIPPDTLAGIEEDMAGVHARNTMERRNVQADLTPEAIEKEQASRIISNRLYNYEERLQKSNLQKFWGDTWAAFMNLKLAADMTPVLYQGGMYAVKSPFKAMKLGTRSLRAGFSSNYHNRGIANLKNQYGPKYVEAKMAGLDIMHENVYGQLPNELVLKSFLDEAPIIGRYTRALKGFSERSYFTLLSEMRLNEYARLTEGITDINALRQIAESINMRTGAGSNFFSSASTNRHFNNLIKNKATRAAFTAPRLYASVTKSLYDITLHMPKRLRRMSRLEKGSPERIAAERILLNDAKILSTQVALLTSGYLLTKMFGTKEDADEYISVNSPQFLRTPIGNEVYNVTPFAGYVKSFGRLVSYGYQNARQQKLFRGTYETLTGNVVDETRSGAFGATTMQELIFDSFFKYRVHPGVSATTRLLFGKDFSGRPLENNTFFDRVITNIMPISVEGFINNVRKGQGLRQITTNFIADNLGLNHYEVDAIRRPEVKRILEDAGYSYKVSNPKWMLRSSREMDDLRDFYKEESSTRLANHLMEIKAKGGTPSENQIRKLKKYYENQVIKEFDLYRKSMKINKQYYERLLRVEGEASERAREFLDKLK